MRLALIPVLLACAGASACQTTTKDAMSTTSTMEMKLRQLEALDVFVGEWTGTATMTEATGTMAATMVGDTKPTFNGGNTTTWTMNRNFLKIDGWHEMGPGQQMKMTELITWDPAAGKYHQWYFSDMGENGEGWMTRDGDTWTTAWTSTKGDGTKSKGKGTMTVTGKTMTWNWAEGDADGSMKMTGTSTKK